MGTSINIQVYDHMLEMEQQIQAHMEADGIEYSRRGVGLSQIVRWVIEQFDRATQAGTVTADMLRPWLERYISLTYIEREGRRVRNVYFSDETAATIQRIGERLDALGNVPFLKTKSGYNRTLIMYLAEEYACEHLVAQRSA